MKAWLTALILAAGGLAAEAQVTIGVGGGSWGWGGCGTGYGLGWGGSWSGSAWGVSGGSVAGNGYGLYYSGPAYVWSGGGSAVATGVVARDLTPGWHPWMHPAHRANRYFWRRPVPSYVPPPPVGAAPPAPPLPSTALEEGKRRFRLGDYRGAVDLFREAVVADAKDTAAEAHFALGLAVTGDHRHADKALRSAVARGFAERLDVAAMLRDERERQKIAGLVAKAPPGSLAAAWALAGMGKPERLEELAETDADAKRLAKAK